MKSILIRSFPIFLFFSTFITLFPPFEFGGEKLKTLYERKLNSKIVEKLPVKAYDFIFNSNKKYFVLDHYSFPRKFYNKDSLNFYKDKWRDKKFVLDNSSVDSFFSANRLLYLKSSKQLKSYKKIKSKRRHKFTFVRRGYRIPPSRIYGSENAYAFLRPKSLFYDKAGNNIVKYYYPETNRDAINYAKVKNEYTQNPKNWENKYILNLDSTKKYDQFSIFQPVYYFLNRKLLIGELSVEYILALIISLIAGYVSKIIRKQ